MQPDIFCLHNRWNTNEVKKLYAPEIPIYFTILRDPVDVFISAWDYVEASRLFFNGQSLENFVMSDKPKPDQQIGQIHLNNSMMYDFGFTSEQSEDTSAIEQKIKGRCYFFYRSEPRCFFTSKMMKYVLRDFFCSLMISLMVMKI